MSKRRGSGEGTIHQLPSGSWRAQVTVEGRRISHTAPTRKACQEWVKQTTGQVDQGLTYEATKTTVEAFLAGWLTSVKASLRLRTYQQYERVARNHITPYIGKVQLGRLRPDQVQAMYDRELSEGKGVRTVQLVHAVLHAALAHALRLGVVMRNVCDAVMPPRQAKTEITPLTEDETNRLLVAVESSRFKVLVYLAIVTGMREGELFGLKWADLDWTTGRLQIARQAQYVIGQGNHFGPPKTSLSRRPIVVGEQALELLRWQFEQVNLYRLAAGSRWQENDLVFPTLVGTPLYSSNWTQHWKKLVAAAGLPPTRFHDLRHLAASIMLVKLRLPPTEVARILGHSRVSTTVDIYGHMLGEMSPEVAAQMEALVFPVRLDAHDRTRKTG